VYWVYAGIGLLLVFAAVSDQLARRRGHHLRASRETYELVREARKQTRRRLTGRLFPGLRTPGPEEFRKPGSRPPPE
jgi:hypothetical protein